MSNLNHEHHSSPKHTIQNSLQMKHQPAHEGQSGTANARSPLSSLIYNKRSRLPSVIDKFLKDGSLENLSKTDVAQLADDIATYHMELQLQNDELRASQQSLEEARDQYQKLYDASPVGYVTLDISGRVLGANRTCENLLGVSAAKMHGRPFSFYVVKLDADTYANFLRGLFLKPQIGMTKRCELRLLTDTQEMVYAAINGVIELNAQGAHVCHLTLDDITEWKASEQQRMLLEAAVEYGRDGISISDPRRLDNPIVYVSPRMEEITGYTAEELIGNNWRMLYTQEPTQPAHSVLKEALASGKKCTVTVRNYRKNGDHYWAEVTLFPLRDSAGAVTHFVNVQRDITDRIKTEEMLRQAQRLDSLGVLAGGIAHDFNNLLVGIMAQVSLIDRKLEAGHAVQKHVDRALRTTERAADLTRQLLAYAGRGRFEVSVLDFNELVRDTAVLVHNNLPSEVKVSAQISGEPLTIRADRAQIQQVVLNLIINASEAIENEGTIRVETARRFLPAYDSNTHFLSEKPLAAGEYVSIIVADNGMGMSDQTISRIFDPFFTTKDKGHGLGLSAVLGVINAHKGGIAVTSTPSIGTVFEVVLPLEVTRSTFEQPASYGDAQPIDQKCKVMVVDDEPFVRESVVEILEMDEIEVISAVSGYEAIRIYQEKQDVIGLVILDMRMPGLNGYMTMERLREINPAVKCLLSSGYTEHEVMQKVEADNGVVDFLQKPYNIDDLRRKVQNILD